MSMTTVLHLQYSVNIYGLYANAKTFYQDKVYKSSQTLRTGPLEKVLKECLHFSPLGETTPVDGAARKGRSRLTGPFHSSGSGGGGEG